MIMNLSLFYSGFNFEKDFCFMKTVFMALAPTTLHELCAVLQSALVPLTVYKDIDSKEKSVPHFKIET